MRKGKPHCLSNPPTHSINFYSRESNQSLVSHSNGAAPANNKLTQMLQQVDNDIRRTDRSHPFYKGDDNPNLVRLRYKKLI